MYSLIKFMYTHPFIIGYNSEAVITIKIIYSSPPKVYFCSFIICLSNPIHPSLLHPARSVPSPQETTDLPLSDNHVDNHDYQDNHVDYLAFS